MNSNDELKALKQQIQIILEPLEKKEKELRRIIAEEDEATQKAIFSIMEGKLFYGNKDTWSGYENTIYLIKPVSCDDWSPYNCCNVIKIAINCSKEKKLTVYLLKMTVNELVFSKLTIKN